MEKHGQRVTRPWAYQNFEMTDDPTYPVTVTLEKMKPVMESTNQVARRLASSSLRGRPRRSVQSTSLV